MKLKNRNIAVCILLSFLTFGLYSLFWKASVVNEIQYISESNSKQSGGLVVFFSIITFGIYKLIWDFNAGRMIERAQELNDIYSPANHGIIYLLLDVFSLSLVSLGLMQYELNRIEETLYSF